MKSVSGSLCKRRGSQVSCCGGMGVSGETCPGPAPAFQRSAVSCSPACDPPQQTHPRTQRKRQAEKASGWCAVHGGRAVFARMAGSHASPRRSRSPASPVRWPGPASPASDPSAIYAGSCHVASTHGLVDRAGGWVAIVIMGRWLLLLVHDPCTGSELRAQPALSIFFLVAGSSVAFQTQKAAAARCSYYWLQVCNGAMTGARRRGQTRNELRRRPLQLKQKKKRTQNLLHAS